MDGDASFGTTPPLSMPGRVVQAMARGFDELGLPGSDSLERARLELTNELQERVSLEAVLRWGDLVVASCSDPDVGLELGARLPFGNRPLLDNLFSACATLGDALTVVDRFGHLASRIFRFRRVDGDPETVRYALEPATGYVPARWHLDFVLARSVFDLRYTLRQNIQLQVGFAYPRPRDLRAHRRLLGNMLDFEQPMSFLQVHRSLMDRALPAANPSLRELLESLARSESETSRDAPASDLDKLRDFMRRHLRDGAATMEQAAQHLGTSSRSLRRHLAHVGASFRGELDAVRKDIALQQLARTELTLDDISYALGFANSTAFHRAFKRWTGETAAGYRERINKTRARA